MVLNKSLIYELFKPGKTPGLNEIDKVKFLIKKEAVVIKFDLCSLFFYL